MAEILQTEVREDLRVAKSKGLLVAMHSDGNVYSIIRDLVEIGLDVLNPCMPRALDLHRVSEEFGGRLTLWGLWTPNILCHSARRKTSQRRWSNELKSTDGTAG